MEYTGNTVTHLVKQYFHQFHVFISGWSEILKKLNIKNIYIPDSDI
jgi:hypothetical protein